MKAEKFVKKSPYTKELEDLSIAFDGSPGYYWRKEFEVQNPRDRQYPKDRAMEQMYMRTLQAPSADFITASQKKQSEAIWRKQEEIAKRIFDAEFWRPRKVVFDAFGNFTRTRMDEQSFL